MYSTSATDYRAAADNVKRAVPVRQGLRLVDWRVRSRGRADCGLCQADHSQRETVSFDDAKGVWHCFRCGAAGSVFDLIMLVHQCDFVTALKFLAAEARVELPTKMTAEKRRRVVQQRAERERINRAAIKVEVAERHLRFTYRNVIHSCERKQRGVSCRLANLMNGEQEQRHSEREGCWSWLFVLDALLSEALAAYALLSFGAARNRAVFILKPEIRHQTIEQIKWDGGVVDSEGRWVGVTV